MDRDADLGRGAWQDTEPWLVSIVIPTKNERLDIQRTLEACLALDYPRKEVVVVDDSDDDTPQLVAAYAGRGVRLVRQQKGASGCCGARNQGLLLARGEIAVLLNADAIPQPDFLRRILRHYAEGAGYVVVHSVVKNRDTAWGRVLSAEGESWIAGQPEMEWSEGFSCRVDAARAVGGIPGDFAVPFCRDWYLGRALGRGGYRKVVDLSITMEHVVPDTLRSFWRNQVWRGTMMAPSAYFMSHRPLPVVALRELARAGRTLLRNFLLIPLFARAVRLLRASRGSAFDLPAFVSVLAIREAALTLGSLRGLAHVVAAAARGAGNH